MTARTVTFLLLAQDQARQMPGRCCRAATDRIASRAAGAGSNSGRRRCMAGGELIRAAPLKTAPGRPGRVPRIPREGSRAALATAAARATEPTTTTPRAN